MAKKNVKENFIEKKNISEWAKKNEVIKTSIPLYLAFFCIKIMPRFLIDFNVKIVSFFYYLFNSRARIECRRFQTKLIDFQNSNHCDCIKKNDCENSFHSKNFINENLLEKKSQLKKINLYNQILAFAITLTEKIECWIKANPSIKINFQNDDVYELIDLLNSGKGAFVICSHLGNSEILRNLANNNHIFLERKIPIAVLMDLGSTKVFTETLKKLNPDFTKNIIDVNSITPGVIEILQETIAAGGLVISAGDRISKNNDSKFLTAPFLGKSAPWSYGVYLIAALLKAPIYFMFGLRKKFASCNRDYNFFIKKSLVDFDCSRKEREEKIKNLCLEFASELEKKCLQEPFQWFNFYDFWAFPK